MSDIEDTIAFATQFAQPDEGRSDDLAFGVETENGDDLFAFVPKKPAPPPRPVTVPPAVKAVPFTPIAPRPVPNGMAQGGTWWDYNGAILYVPPGETAPRQHPQHSFAYAVLSFYHAIFIREPDARIGDMTIHHFRELMNIENEATAGDISYQQLERSLEIWDLMITGLKAPPEEDVPAEEAIDAPAEPEPAPTHYDAPITLTVNGVSQDFLLQAQPQSDGTTRFVVAYEIDETEHVYEIPDVGTRPEAVEVLRRRFVAHTLPGFVPPDPVTTDAPLTLISSGGRRYPVTIRTVEIPGQDTRFELAYSLGEDRSVAFNIPGARSLPEATAQVRRSFEAGLLDGLDPAASIDPDEIEDAGETEDPLEDYDLLERELDGLRQIIEEYEVTNEGAIRTAAENVERGRWTVAEAGDYLKTNGRQLSGGRGGDGARPGSVTQGEEPADQPPFSEDMGVSAEDLAMVQALPYGEVRLVKPEGTGLLDVVDVLASNRAHNLRVTREGTYRVAVPRADGTVAQYENLTLQQAKALAVQAAAARGTLSAMDILVNANGVIDDPALRAQATRQSEVVWSDPEMIETGPPPRTWPAETLPDQPTLTQEEIDQVVAAIAAYGGDYRAGLADFFRRALAPVSRGHLNGVLYEILPRYFRARQIDTLAQKARDSAEAGDIDAVFRSHDGLLATGGSHRFGQYRDWTFDNITVIAAPQIVDGQPVIRGPYQTIYDNIRANAADYGIVERNDDGAWTKVEITDPAERLRAVREVIEGTDRTRGVAVDGRIDQWVYTWGPGTREADGTLKNMGGRQPDDTDIFVGIAPTVTDDAITENLALAKEIIDFSNQYVKGAAEQAVLAILFANMRAIPMATDRSSASNTIAQAVLLAASQLVAIGNPADADEKYYDLNLAPLTMEMDDALREQLAYTPLTNARTGETYTAQERLQAVDRVLEDMKARAPDLYERIFGSP